MTIAGPDRSARICGQGKHSATTPPDSSLVIHHALPLPCRQARAGEALLLRRALGAFVCTALPQGRPARCPLNSVIEQFSGIRWTLPLLPATGANHCLMQPLSLFWNTARACQQRRQPWGEGVEALQHHAEAALDYCRLASTCLHPTFSTASSQSWLLTPVTFESSMGAPTQLLCDVRNLHLLLVTNHSP